MLYFAAVIGWFAIVVIRLANLLPPSFPGWIVGGVKLVKRHLRQFRVKYRPAKIVTKKPFEMILPEGVPWPFPIVLRST